MVLLNLDLHDTSAIEVIRELRKSSPSTHIVVLITKPDSRQVFEALCAGAISYRQRISPPELILETVSMATSGVSLIHSSIAELILERFQRVLPQATEFEALTERERDILTQYASGKRVMHVAVALNLNAWSIYGYARMIYRKLEIRTLAEAAAKPKS